MRNVLPPPEVRELDDALGAVHYSFFADADDEALTLEGAVLWHVISVIEREYITGRIDPALLPVLPRKLIDRPTFFGSMFDIDRDALVRRGRVSTTDGEWFDSPTFEETSGRIIASWSASGPSSDGYAAAFTSPPWHLQLTGAQCNDLFRRLNALILSATGDERILDWSSDRLADFSEHFEAGSEWWGAYLYTIHHPATRQLVVISASTSD